MVRAYAKAGFYVISNIEKCSKNGQKTFLKLTRIYCSGIFKV